jgi:DNA-binding NarL/FixJ family response regulator
MSRPRTAILADPQPAFRAGLAAALKRSDIDVLAEVATMRDVVARAAELGPGVCIVDAGLPGGALAATKRIGVVAPETLVVVLGGAEDEEFLLAAVRAGASGYLPRSSSEHGLARAIDAVLDGTAAITRAGVSALVRELRTHGARRSPLSRTGVDLTARETRVAELLRDGLPTRAIAEELGLSPVTVRRHLGSVASKLGVDGREALLRALRDG